MPASALDTLRAGHTFAEAGFPANQVNAIVFVIRDALVESVATKACIEKLDAKIDRTAAQIRDEVKADIAKIDDRISRLESKLLHFGIAIPALVTALFKIL